MSLQIWLPLNGDLHNQGLVDWNPSGSNVAYVNSGKIGKALNTGGVVMPASVTKQVLNNNEFSYCCWIYVKGTTGSTTERAMIFGNEGTTAPNNRKFSIFQYPTCNDLHLSWQNDETNKTFLASHAYGVLPSNEWTHLAVTYKNPTCIVYINGIKRFTYTGTSNSASFEYDTKFIHNSAYHYLNDVRLYDHCLSAKEVKEIAKGLVLHYRLAGPGGENLLSGGDLINKDKPVNANRRDFCNSITSITATSEGLHLVTPSDAGNHNNGFLFVYTSADTTLGLTYGDTITFSVEIKGTDDSNQAFLGIHSNYTNTSGWWYSTGNYGKTELIQDVSNSNWKRYSVTATLPSKPSSPTIFYLGVGVHGNMGCDFYIRNAKLEKGSIATPWCPNPSDALYHTLGYDNGIEYDCSGFGNNGTKKSAIEWDANSPRYMSSYKFNGKSNCRINISNPWTTGSIIPELTHTAWIKWDSTCSASNGLHSISYANAFFRFSLGKGNKLWAYGLKCKEDGSSSSAGRLVEYGSSSELVDQKWYFIAVTYNKGVCKAYLNGTLVQTIDHSATYQALLDNTGTGSIGSYNGDSELGIGNVSDSRLYATALSDSDILELYNVGASITNNGAVMLAGEVVEE